MFDDPQDISKRQRQLGHPGLYTKVAFRLRTGALTKNRGGGNISARQVVRNGFDHVCATLCNGNYEIRLETAFIDQSQQIFCGVAEFGVSKCLNTDQRISRLNNSRLYALCSIGFRCDAIIGKNIHRFERLKAILNIYNGVHLGRSGQDGSKCRRWLGDRCPCRGRGGLNISNSLHVLGNSQVEGARYRSPDSSISDIYAIFFYGLG